jgi:serine/threonine protein phosphatase PrpC
MRCPRCAEPVESLRFCESCGQDLWRRSAGWAVMPPDGPCPGCGEDDAEAEAGYCPSCGLRRPDGTERVDADLGALAGVSDRGRVHPRNEDAMAIGRLAAPGPHAALAAVVCDGVSSVRRPELASRAAADTTLEVLLGAPSPNGAEAQVREAVAEAAAAVAALAGGEPDAPACTLVCAMVRAPEGEPPEITVGWVGDSRAYWLAEEGASLLTVDHSWAVQMVAAGLLDEATAMTDPNAHAITRWLGTDGVTEPEVVTCRPAGPGALLLCSDGLWNYLPDPADLAALTLPLVGRDGPLAAASTLTAVALDSGGHDNITAVVIPVPSAASEEPES